jgi:hypothetical protein
VLNGVAKGGALLAVGVVLNGYRIGQLVVNTGDGYWHHVHANGPTAAPVLAPVPAPVSRQEVATQVVDKLFWEYADFPNIEISSALPECRSLGQGKTFFISTIRS